MTNSGDSNTHTLFTKYDSLIKDHYDNVAKVDKDSATSTMVDLFIRNAETEFIINMIRAFMQQQRSEFKDGGENSGSPGEDRSFTVLDVGCGNGYTLETISQEFPKLLFRGVELNDCLRSIAQQRFADKSIRVTKGDIRLFEPFENMKVDVLICQRVIINLLDVQHQTTALRNMIKIMNRGGLLIFIESFKSGLISLNDARTEFGLPLLSPAHHNLYLETNFFKDPALDPFDLSSENFLSTHYFISRVLHPSFLDVHKAKFERNSNFVSFFSQAFPPSVGNYSPLKLFSFLKR